MEKEEQYKEILENPAFKFICEKMMYVEFLQWLGKQKP